MLQNDRQYVSFTDKLAVDDVVTIKFISDTKADNSYYEISRNLENNASNDIFETLTLRTNKKSRN